MEIFFNLQYLLNREDQPIETEFPLCFVSTELNKLADAQDQCHNLIAAHRFCLVKYIFLRKTVFFFFFFTCLHTFHVPLTSLILFPYKYQYWLNKYYTG